VTDFLSRLVARSSGEKPDVRPRIVPAFAQRHEIAEQLPAGEVLRGAPEASRAIAPLPVQNSNRTSPNHRRPEQISDVPAPSSRGQISGFHPTEVPSSREQRQNEKVETQVTLLPASQNKAVVPAQSSVPKPTVDLEVRSHRDKAIESTQVQRGPATAAAVSREAKDVVKAISKLDEPALVPPIFPLVRPTVSKSELPLEAPKKKTANEPPAIQVTIGKIEVRASIAGPKSGEKKISTGVMSLEEYQRLRSRRSAG
jgi:hypothetical protein